MSYPKGTVLADLGCGDAALAKQLLPKGVVVLSYDLISCNAFVIAADICDHLPLPGGECRGSEALISQVVDIAVCSLSLMSTNWMGCIKEAWRILKLRQVCSNTRATVTLIIKYLTRGKLEIAEVASRFVDLDDFISLICSTGFKLETKVSDP